MLLAIHDSFRGAVARLASTEGAPRRDLFARLASSLHHHHHAEEVLLFPQVARHAGVPPQALIDDHQVLMQTLDATAAALDDDEALARLHDVLVDHLDREEGMVIPMMLEGHVAPP